jgi:uncharacterized protein involved in exopolysaccharide biosynthesis
MANEQKGSPKYDFASTDLLIYIWRKRVPLLIISAAAAILSIIVSFTITPLFKSTVIMFPVASASVSKNLLADNYSGRYSIYEIGDEEQAEKLMQVLNSEEIKNRIIEKYNLKDHYGIEPDSKYPLTQLNEAYRSKIRIRRTEFMSVEVEVKDKDAQMASDIANDISSLTDTIFSDMLRQRALQAFLIVEKEYNDMLSDYRMTQDSLKTIRVKGVNNHVAQADRYHEAYGKALVLNNTNAIKVLEDKFEIMEEYGGDYDVFNVQLSYYASILSRLKLRYIEAKIELEQALPHKFIVDRAVRADKKIYPKKSVIVIVSTLSAFLLGLLLLILNDNLKSKLT